MIVDIALIIGSYLFGSISWGYFLGKYLKGVDIRKKDLPGAAGSFRQFGPAIGISVGLLDASKGIIPMLIANALGVGYLTIILSALAALIGHNWPIFFQFNGGGGLATILGISICLVPKEMLIAFALAISTGFVYRYGPFYNPSKIHQNIFGAGIGLICLPFLTWHFGRPLYLTILAVLLFLVSIIRGMHMLYIKRKQKIEQGKIKK